LYYWQGTDSSKNDKGTSGLLATDVFKEINKNGSEIVMIRIQQHKETEHFKLMFKGKFVTLYGDKDNQQTIRLFRIREAGNRMINAIQVHRVR
jgi:hypothetical protein